LSAFDAIFYFSFVENRGAKNFVPSLAKRLPFVVSNETKQYDTLPGFFRSRKSTFRWATVNINSAEIRRSMERMLTVCRFQRREAE
jgi:hypothetical protein